MGGAAGVAVVDSDFTNLQSISSLVRFIVKPARPVPGIKRQWKKMAISTRGPQEPQ